MSIAIFYFLMTAFGFCIITLTMKTQAKEEECQDLKRMRKISSWWSAPIVVKSITTQKNAVQNAEKKTEKK